ncbi:MAG: hypothetical protein U0169_10010 [Polyangiaceae bacterium]
MKSVQYVVVEVETLPRPSSCESFWRVADENAYAAENETSTLAASDEDERIARSEMETVRAPAFDYPKDFDDEEVASGVHERDTVFDSLRSFDECEPFAKCGS